MKKGISPVMLIGAAGAAYLLLKPSAASGGGGVAQTLANLLPGSQPQVPTNYGINSGVRGNLNGVYTVSNYAQLLAANPNLGNPYYKMTEAEISQYLSNYIDLQQGLPSWIGHKQPDGTKPQNISQAAQEHWLNFGCAEKRIFLPLEPPSNIPYVPPPPAPKSSGSGVLGSILKAVTIVAGGAITVATGGAAAPLVAAGESAALTAESAIHGPDTTGLLNDAEIQLLFQSAAVIYDILPLYANNDPVLTRSIKLRLDELLKHHT